MAIIALIVPPWVSKIPWQIKLIIGLSFSEDRIFIFIGANSGIWVLQPNMGMLLYYDTFQCQLS